jgi:hypothetical protein
MTYAKRTLLMALTGGFSGEADDDGQSVSDVPQAKAKAADVPRTGKHLQYQQGAINAINDATDRASAQKHLVMVRLRAKEKAVPADVFHRVEAEFTKKWNAQEVEA